ncbi:hypothetical protein [uncultured Parolsenella sp.]|uniref:hypothetical protein n=1 Tax=uncultured Parolsenella sp. TaxID=2083008 RepID=UPI002600D1D3|nr:hypothetical protein [uncultured Parolsenella sp.]
MADKDNQQERDVELRIEEDRTRLLVCGLGLLVLVFAILFAAVCAYALADVTGNIALLLVVVVAITAVWFISKRMGRLLGKYAAHVGVCDFGTSELTIYEKADVTKAVVVPYKQIKGYSIVHQGSSLRLLLWGSWVTHPAGYEYVGITRPFMKDTLDDLEGQIEECMARHHVKKHK